MTEPPIQRPFSRLMDWTRQIGLYYSDCRPCQGWTNEHGPLKCIVCDIPIVNTPLLVGNVKLCTKLCSPPALWDVKLISYRNMIIKTPTLETKKTYTCSIPTEDILIVSLFSYRTFRELCTLPALCFVLLWFSIFCSHLLRHDCSSAIAAALENIGTQIARIS